MDPHGGSKKFAASVCNLWSVYELSLFIHIRSWVWCLRFNTPSEARWLMAHQSFCLKLTPFLCWLSANFLAWSCSSESLHLFYTILSLFSVFPTPVSVPPSLKEIKSCIQLIMPHVQLYQKWRLALLAVMMVVQCVPQNHHARSEVKSYFVGVFFSHHL